MNKYKQLIINVRLYIDYLSKSLIDTSHKNSYLKVRIKGYDGGYRFLGVN